MSSVDQQAVELLRQRRLGDLLAQRQEGEFISLEEGERRTQEMIARKRADRGIGRS